MKGKRGGEQDTKKLPLALNNLTGEKQEAFEAGETYTSKLYKHVSTLIQPPQPPCVFVPVCVFSIINNYWESSQVIMHEKQLVHHMLFHCALNVYEKLFVCTTHRVGVQCVCRL